MDVDSAIWLKLRQGLRNHQASMNNAYEALQAHFEGYREHDGDGTSLLTPFNGLSDYDALTAAVGEIVNDLPRYPCGWRKSDGESRFPHSLK